MVGDGANQEKRKNSVNFKIPLLYVDLELSHDVYCFRCLSIEAEARRELTPIGVLPSVYSLGRGYYEGSWKNVSSWLF